MRKRRRSPYTDGYFKVSRRLLTSSLWAENSDVLRVLLCLLEMAQDPKGPRDGTVIIARPILAARTLLTPDRLSECLAVLEGPDPASRTSDFEGRRVEALPNGFRLLNHDLYHDEATETALREARSRAGRLGGVESGKSRRGATLSRSKPEANPEQNEATDTDTETDTETTETNERTASSPAGPDPKASRSDAVDEPLRIVRPPMTPERQALRDAREAVRRELLAVTMLRGASDGQRELARASKTPGGQVIVNPESCNSLPWLRTTYERLVARRMELEERQAEDSPPPLPPAPPVDPEAEALFEAVRVRLAGVIDSRVFATWIRPLSGLAFSTTGGLVIACPNEQFREWVTHNHGAQIERALVDLGRSGSFALAVVAEPAALHSGSIR